MSISKASLSWVTALSLPGVLMVPWASLAWLTVLPAPLLTLLCLVEAEPFKSEMGITPDHDLQQVYPGSELLAWIRTQQDSLIWPLF